MAGGRLDHIRRYILKNGLKHTAYQAWLKTKDYYLRSYHRHKAAPDELQAQHLRVFKAPPLISVVVPVFNTRPEYLSEMALSVVEQSYPHWELCLLDGGSEKPATLAALKELSRLDKRIRVERAKENLGIAGNTNLAIDMARGAYVALLDHDDTLTPDALYWVADAVEKSGAEVIYSDEDKMQHEGKYLFTPHLKPDYSPEFLKSCNYFCHLMVIKTSLLKEIGGLRIGFDGSQDHDLALRASWQAEKIYHIPRVLYHWRQDANSMSHRNLEKCVDAGRRAVIDQLAREGVSGHVEVIHGRNCVTYDVIGAPQATILLWHEGSAAKLNKCRDLIQKSAGYEGFEIVVVEGDDRCRALNEAAQRAAGDFLVFMDSGVEVERPGWLARWIGYCQRETCLSVCPKLIDRRRRLAFAGYVVGVNPGVVVPQRGYPADSWGYFGVKELTHNVASSSWALMIVKREDFLALDGFDESLPALADVDWCLSASKKLGGWHIYDPYFKAKTSGGGLWTKRDAAWEPFNNKWPELQDPYYNPQWSRENGNFTLL